MTSCPKHNIASFLFNFLHAIKIFIQLNVKTALLSDGQICKLSINLFMNINENIRCKRKIVKNKGLLLQQFGSFTT